MNWYLAVLKKYAVFEGRARRKEYWLFVLFNFIIEVVLAIIDNVIGTAFNNNSYYGWLTMIYALAVIIPTWAVTVRRLHDVGKSGWWIFISLVPLIGGFWLLYLEVSDSQPGENQYGPNPKEERLVTPAS